MNLKQFTQPIEENNIGGGFIKRISNLLPTKNPDHNAEDNIPALSWVKLNREGRITAEVLVSAEIYEINFAANLAPVVKVVEGMPKAIELDLMKVKVLCLSGCF